MSKYRLHFHHQASEASIADLSRAVRPEECQPGILERLQRLGKRKAESRPEPIESEARHAHSTRRKRASRGRRVSAANGSAERGMNGGFLNTVCHHGGTDPIEISQTLTWVQLR